MLSEFCNLVQNKAKHLTFAFMRRRAAGAGTTTPPAAILTESKMMITGKIRRPCES
jgi:hypothetical protein